MSYQNLKLCKQSDNQKVVRVVNRQDSYQHLKVTIVCKLCRTYATKFLDSRSTSRGIFAENLSLVIFSWEEVISSCCRNTS